MRSGARPQPAAPWPSRRQFLSPQRTELDGTFGPRVFAGDVSPAHLLLIATTAHGSLSNPGATQHTPPLAALSPHSLAVLQARHSGVPSDCPFSSPLTVPKVCFAPVPFASNPSSALSLPFHLCARVVCMLCGRMCVAVGQDPGWHCGSHP